MGLHYCHLSANDRIRIEVMLQHGLSRAWIARVVGCHRSTIGRELKRARRFGPLTYVADFGQRYYAQSRRRAGLARRKLGADLHSPAWQHVLRGLAARHSPQEIAGRLRLSCQPFGCHLDEPRYVSHQTIYCALYALPRGTLRSHLMSQLCRSRNGRRRRPRSASPTKTADMTPIALRPAEVAARIVPGHWEGDLIKGKGNRSAVGTLVERTSRYIMLVKLDGMTAGDILEGFTRRLKEIPPSLRKTLTYDQGSEMAMHKELAKRLRIDVFFCDAHSPWQRPSNENANGIIREFLPKGMDLWPFTQDDLCRLEDVLNNTPRKILGYYTPLEVFSRLKLDQIAGVALQA